MPARAQDQITVGMTLENVPY